MKEEVERVRCFVALDLSEGMIASIREYQKELSFRNFCAGRLTDPDNMHLTLKFLGEIPLKLVEKTRESLRHVRFKPFEAMITRAGVFNEKLIRIIWLALGSDDVMNLQKQVDDSLEDDFEREARFMGHITIIRVNHVKDKEGLLRYLQETKLPGAKDMINSFSLIRSTLTPKGPVYEVIERYEMVSNG